eukprot:883962_1
MFKHAVVRDKIDDAQRAYGRSNMMIRDAICKTNVGEEELPQILNLTNDLLSVTSNYTVKRDELCVKLCAFGTKIGHWSSKKQRGRDQHDYLGKSAPLLSLFFGEMDTALLDVHKILEFDSKHNPQQELAIKNAQKNEKELKAIQLKSKEEEKHAADNQKEPIHLDALNKIHEHNNALMTAVIVKLHVLGGLHQFKDCRVAPCLTLAKDVENCSLGIMQSQASIRSSIMVARKLAEFKPSKGCPQGAPLWSPINKGIGELFNHHIQLSRMAKTYFTFFGKFGAHFKDLPVQGWNTGTLQAEINQFVAFNAKMQAIVDKIRESAKTMIRDCISQTAGARGFDEAQKEREKGTAQLLEIHRLKVQMDKHPKEWTASLVATWLGSLEDDKCERRYQKYTDMFVENVVDGEDLIDLDVDTLKDYGVKKVAHRKGIMREAKQLLNTYEQEMEQLLSAYDHDDVKVQSENSDMSNQALVALSKHIQRVDKVLVMFFGMSFYKSATYPNLDDIHDDEKYFRDVFEKMFNYRFITNDGYDQTWKKSDAEEWIEVVRDSELLHNRQVQYDGLIFCGASHGSMHSMICSDGEELKMKDIRSSFASNVNRQFRDLPKIFIFNCCRTPYQKPQDRGTEEETRAAGYSVTITSTEGDKVFGSRLSRFVADAFTDCCENKTNVHDTLYAATEMAKKTMELRLQEYDLKVGRVVFLKGPDPLGRGVVTDSLSDADDDLTNILRPQKGGSKMDLFYKQYYSALFESGFRTNASLCKLTKDKLNKLGITMVFHQKELLKRVATL